MLGSWLVGPRDGSHGVRPRHVLPGGRERRANLRLQSGLGVHALVKRRAIQGRRSAQLWAKGRDGVLRQPRRDHALQLQARPPGREPDATATTATATAVADQRVHVRRLLLLRGRPRSQVRRAARVLVPAYLPDLRSQPELQVRDTPAVRGKQHGQPVQRAEYALRQGCLPAMDLSRQPPGLVRHLPDADLRVHRGLLGFTAPREDAGRPLSHRLVTRLRRRPPGFVQPVAKPSLLVSVRKRLEHERGNRQEQSQPNLGWVREADRVRCRGFLRPLRPRWRYRSVDLSDLRRLSPTEGPRRVPGTIGTAATGRTATTSTSISIRSSASSTS